MQSNRKTPSKDQAQQLEAGASIQLLLDAVQAEHVAFSFDYLVFHKECWTLLRRVKEACAESLTKKYGPGWIEQENQLPFTVGWIFMSASDAAKVETQLATGDSGKVMSKLLLEGAEAYNDFIHEGFGESVVHHQDRYFPHNEFIDHPTATPYSDDSSDDFDDSDGSDVEGTAYSWSYSF